MTIRPTHSLYGEPANKYQTQAPRPGCSPAPPGGMPYEGGKVHCIGNNETCKGWPAKGTVWCVGHLKALASKADADALAAT